MNSIRQVLTAGLILALGACSSMPENVIAMPEIELSDIEVVGLGFNGQTVLLSFEMSNPNPFPLPVNHIRYSLKLDGMRLASGETPCGITVPAGGSADFAISVELDLLSTAPQLLSVVRDGGRKEIPYELKGQLGIDIPMIPTVSYRTNGSIKFN